MPSSDFYGDPKISIHDAIGIVEEHFKDEFFSADKSEKDLENGAVAERFKLKLKDFFVSSVSLVDHYVKPFDPEQVMFFKEYKWIVVISHKWRNDRYYVFVVGADGKPKLILQIV